MSSPSSEGSVFRPNQEVGVYGLTNALMEHEVGDVWEQIVAVGDNIGRNPLYLLRMATIELLSSGEPGQEEVGIKSLFWEACNFPDPETADGLAYDAKYDSRNPETREIAGRMFEASVQHLRSAAQLPDFAPTTEYIGCFDKIVARIEEEGYPELYQATLREFAPLAVVAAINSDSREGTEASNGHVDLLDNALMRCASVIRESDPDLAALARSLVRGELYSQILAEQNADYELRAAFASGDLVTAKQILGCHEQMLLAGLWGDVTKRVTTLDSEDLEWGHVVVNTILEAKPDYFSLGYPDIFYSAHVGLAIGILGREDVVSSLIEPDGNINECGRTMRTLAFAYGATGNQEAFERLLGIIELDDKIKEILQKCYDGGIQETNELSTETQ